MGREHAADQDDRQSERLPRAMPGQIQHQRHGASGAELQQRGAVGEARQRRQLHRVAGDDPDRAEGDEQSSRPEEAADHGVRHVADRPAHPRQAQPAQHDPRHRGRQAEGDQHRREQGCRGIGGLDALDHRGRQNSRDGRGRAVGRGNGERQRATEPDHRGKYRGADEGRGDAVGQIGRERAGKDQQRIGQAESKGEDTRGPSAQHVIQCALGGRTDPCDRIEANCRVCHAGALAHENPDPRGRPLRA